MRQHKLELQDCVVQAEDPTLARLQAHLLFDCIGIYKIFCYSCVRW